MLASALAITQTALQDTQCVLFHSLFLGNGPNMRHRTDFIYLNVYIFFFFKKDEGCTRTRRRLLSSEMEAGGGVT